MINNQYSLRNLRKIHYSFQHKKFPFLKDWKRSPYTFLKAKFYIETSVVLVFLLLKTSIKPNTITIIYGLCGIAGGILLVFSTKLSILIAIFIFFNKGILDWSDGLLARIKEQTSLTGHILDTYGAQLNSLGLQIGLGFYVAQKSENIWFYYLIPLVPFFYAANLMHYTRRVLSFPEIVSDQLKKFSSEKNKTCFTAIKSKNIQKIMLIRKVVESILDDRARSVDFICLILFLEVFYDFFWSWIIFCILIIKQFIKFLGAFYAVSSKKLAEQMSEEICENILKVKDLK